MMDLRSESSQRLDQQLLAIYAAVSPGSEEIPELLSAGISPRRVKTLYGVDEEQWPATLAHYFTKPEVVQAWFSVLGKDTYSWGEGEEAMQVSEAKRNIWHRATRNLDYDVHQRLEALRERWKSDEHLDELAASVRQGVRGEHEPLKLRFCTIMQILVLGGWWDLIEEGQVDEAEYRSMLAGVAVSFGLKPLPYWG
jgi:hypothetical protein